ncbi:hypothetical protein BDW75DRAFT_197633 [Aspergillus navahoensis]
MCVRVGVSLQGCYLCFLSSIFWTFLNISQFGSVLLIGVQGWDVSAGDYHYQR